GCGVNGRICPSHHLTICPLIGGPQLCAAPVPGPEASNGVLVAVSIMNSPLFGLFRRISPLIPAPYSFWKSGRNATLSNSDDELKSIPIPSRFVPRLVVIRMTPFAAWEPYSAAAPAPLSTLIDATSFGLMSLIPVPRSRSYTHPTSL